MRNQKAIIALVATIGFVQYTSANVVGCSAELDANIWNLNPIRRTKDQGDYTVNFSSNGVVHQVFFNLCSNTIKECKLADETTGDEAFAVVVLPDGKCHRLTQDDMDESVASYFDKNAPEAGLTLTYESEEKCNDKENYGFTIDIKCDEDGEHAVPRVSDDSVSKNDCHPRVYFESESGCITRSFSKVWKTFQNISIGFGVGLLIMGGFLTFFGATHQSATLFIAGFFGGSLGSLVFLYGVIMPSFTPEWAHMVAFFVCGLAGMVIGLFAAMWTKFGIACLGGWVGCSTGFMVYDAIFSQLVSGRGAQFVFWFLIMLFIIIGVLLAVYMMNHAIALGSSVVGAYALVRAFGIFIGGFPNEYLVYMEIQNGGYASMPDAFYIYLGVFVVVAIAGMIVQERELLHLKYQEYKDKKAGKGKNDGNQQEDHEETKEDEEKPLINREKKDKKDKKEKKHK